MSFLFRKSRGVIFFIMLLLSSYPAWASPPSDAILPSIHATATEAPDTPLSVGDIHIVALMVEFQEEDNRFTSGNGTFDIPYLQRDDIIIDPLPHDQGYFEAHLSFAKNYFETVSNGLLNIDFTVLPEIVGLDNPMSTYAPMGQTDEENFKLANLARDAWSEAAEQDLPDLSHIDQDRTMFIVFHAGSGRNIELMGTNLNKTPQDIPSVYLGTSSLERLLNYGENDFNGFALGNSGLRVTNSALLPQTQSRAGEDVVGDDYVLELSINGLLAANIGNFLGLPDLFNTETGASAIGRFGLMDGAAIFSYLGMFPPEPSAWEKIHLGWAEPFDIQLDTGEPVNLPAVSYRGNGMQKPAIARHSLSADEYFLIENRHRNPSDNPSETPLEITIRTPDGNYVTREIDPMDERFNPLNASEYDEILEPGVVVNVSNFDWSLPGGPDTATDDDNSSREDRLLNGGILIWHIDDAVIRRTIDDNNVNAQTERRGVQLMEADGAQDIGRPPRQQQDRFTNGHAFDFWWSGNDFTVITASNDSLVVYENRFGPDTQPSNESNTGSPSFFEFYDFSDNIVEAYFYARSLDDVYTRLPDTPLPALPVSPGLTDETAIYPASPNLVATGHASSKNQTQSAPYSSRNNQLSDNDRQPISTDMQLVIPTLSGFYSIALDGSQSDYSFIEHPYPTTPLIQGNRLTAGQYRPGSMADRQMVGSWIFETGDWSQSWITEDLPAGPGFPSLENQNVIHLDHTATLLDAADGSLRSDQQDQTFQRSGSVDGASARLENDRLTLPGPSYHYDLNRDERASTRKYTGNLRFSADSEASFFLLTDHRLHLFDKQNDGDWHRHSLFESQWLSWPAFADWTGDNALEIFITDAGGKAIHGKNRDGGIVDRFPLPAPNGQHFTGSILLADITGDNQNELIAAAKDSLTFMVHAFDRNLNPVDGFPLMVGSMDPEPASSSQENIKPPQTSALPLIIAENHLFAVSPSGEVRAWELTELGDVEWGHIYGPQDGNKVGITVDDHEHERQAFDLLNKAQTYNWPNPADDHTHIRYETADPAQIDITVINPSGAVIFEKQAESRGRFPEEIRLNTSSWGNGVYFGRIRARNEQGSETQILKIVVTH